MSHRFLSTVAFSLGLMLTPLAASSAELHVAFDISDSFPLMVNRNIAASAARTVADKVSALRPGDKIHLRSLGTAGIAVQQINIHVEVGRKANARADRIAPAIAELVASLPDRIAHGDLKVQSSTNIIGFVEALAPSLDCQAEETTLLIFSDGIEWSSLVNGSDLVNGKVDLPLPHSSFLDGCNVELRGLGQQTATLGTDARWFPVLRDQWTRYFTAAGVARFKAYAAFE